MWSVWQQCGECGCREDILLDLYCNLKIIDQRLITFSSDLSLCHDLHCLVQRLSILEHIYPLMPSIHPYNIYSSSGICQPSYEESFPFFHVLPGCHPRTQPQQEQFLQLQRKHDWNMLCKTTINIIIMYKYM